MIQHGALQTKGARAGPLGDFGLRSALKQLAWENFALDIFRKKFEKKNQKKSEKISKKKIRKFFEFFRKIRKI